MRITIRRRLPIVFAVFLAAAAVSAAVILRKHAPPEPARLLPSADAFFYVDLKWMRRENVAGKLPNIKHDPEYEQFIQATGFQFERDLEEAAFAIHYSDGSSNSQLGETQPRFSEVFVAKIQGERLREYLRRLSSSVDNFRSIDIFNIPLEGRTLRVAVLGVDTVAASNHADPNVIRGIIERSRKLASPFGGPALLRQYYKHVPFTSLVWGIFRAQPGAPQGQKNIGGGPFDLSFLLTKPAVIVASVRYLTAVHFKAEAFTGSDEAAERLTEQLGTFLTIFRSAESSLLGRASDADVKQFFESLKIEQRKDRTVLTANIPIEFIRKAIAEVPNELSPQVENVGPRQATPRTSVPAAKRRAKAGAN
ncbi:MAG: hypothetical protein M3O09_16380 [Acidobacteriota bacterium]|nr:hypothetical protein [Acidobacteriota bacterium]